MHSLGIQPEFKTDHECSLKVFLDETYKSWHEAVFHFPSSFPLYTYQALVTHFNVHILWWVFTSSLATSDAHPFRSKQRFVVFFFCPWEKEISQYEVLRTAKCISCRGKKGICPFHTDFQVFVLCFISMDPKETRGMSNQLQLLLMHVAATQHLWLSPFLFLIVCSGVHGSFERTWIRFFPWFKSTHIQSAMLLARGLFSLACMQLPVFSGIGVLSPTIPKDRRYLRFRVFVSRQNLGRSGNSKIPHRLLFSPHMKPGFLMVYTAFWLWCKRRSDYGVHVLWTVVYTQFSLRCTRNSDYGVHPVLTIV